MVLLSSQLNRLDWIRRTPWFLECHLRHSSKSHGVTPSNPPYRIRRKSQEWYLTTQQHLYSQWIGVWPRVWAPMQIDTICRNEKNNWTNQDNHSIRYNLRRSKSLDPHIFFGGKPAINTVSMTSWISGMTHQSKSHSKPGAEIPNPGAELGKRTLFWLWNDNAWFHAHSDCSQWSF